MQRQALFRNYNHKNTPIDSLSCPCYNRNDPHRAKVCKNTVYKELHNVQQGTTTRHNPHANGVKLFHHKLRFA